MEHKREGGKDMAVLAKPIGVAFEVEPSKVKAFLNLSRKHTLSDVRPNQRYPTRITRHKKAVYE